MNKNQSKELQRITRFYLSRLRSTAKKYGLLDWLNDTIQSNKQGKCAATEKEAELLARMCEDDRITRQEIPLELGVSYRHCVDNNVFERIKQFKHVGIYSKISTLLFAKKKGYDK